MHVMCTLDVNLMFCIKISATIHAQLHKHCCGAFHAEVLQLLEAVFCATPYKLRIIWTIKFQKGDSKIPTLLLCCCSHIGEGHLSHLLLPTTACLLLRKMPRRSWVPKEENAEWGCWERHGLTSCPLCELRPACVSCAHTNWKGGERGWPQQSSGSSGSAFKPRQAHCQGRGWEAFRAGGQWVWTAGSL